MQCECGAPIREGQAFCGNCGKPVKVAVGETLVNVPASNPSPGLGTAMPIALTTKNNDFWKLGALAVILLSLFLPAVSLPAGLALSPIRFGVLAWLAVIVVLAIAALTAVPSWRPRFWPDVERFLSAAMVGSVVTVFGIVIGLASALSHVIQSISNSTSGLGGLVSGALGSTVSLSVHIGFGLVLALVGTVAWAVTTRRAG